MFYFTSKYLKLHGEKNKPLPHFAKLQLAG